jgi:hydroxymethylpyrimidine kinase/phosphomethylpyrimidine kinase
MTIAGSDCSGGAGVQADLKTFCSLGVYGISAVTCVVAENASFVGSIMQVPVEILSEQIKLCADGFEIEFVKTGMLPNAEVIDVVKEELSCRNLKVIVDPVMVASTGTRLISPEAVAVMKKDLLPECFLMTPNLDEAALLLGKTQITESELFECASRLSDIYQCAVFLKGGHLTGKYAVDVLVYQKGREVYNSERITGVNTHGTGCTLSAAITGALARGQDLPSACATAKQFVTNALMTSVQTKLGKLLNHNKTT